MTLANLRNGLLVLFFTDSATALALEQTRDLYLTVSEKITIAATGMAVTEKTDVIQVSDLGQKFEIRAKKTGSALLKVGSQVYRIQVLSWKAFSTKALLEKLLPQTLGLQVKIADSKTQVAGRLLRCEDWQLLHRSCVDNSCEYVASFSWSETLKQRCLGAIRAEIQKRNLPLVNIHDDGVLRATIATETPMKNELGQFLRSYGISLEHSKDQTTLAPMVKVQIMIAEVRRDFSQKIGIDWPQGIDFQVIPKLENEKAFSAFASALQNEGSGQVLANPSILCRSGKSAEFAAGGEFPIKILNYKIQDIVWKRYGIFLKIQPQADLSGHMSIGVDTEISSLDPARAVDGIPGLLTNRIQSHFDLSKPQTIALSGLIKHEQGQSSRGLFGLANIPILGKLFASDDFKENKTELVILVRPEMFREENP